MCPPTHLKNRDRYSLRSHRITYFISLTARVYSYLGTNHRRHGGIYTLAHTRDVTHLNLTELDSYNHSVYTQLAYTISPPNEVVL
jgi:hypothetical protein